MSVFRTGGKRENTSASCQYFLPPLYTSGLALSTRIEEITNVIVRVPPLITCPIRICGRSRIGGVVGRYGPQGTGTQLQSQLHPRFKGRIAVLPVVVPAIATFGY